jgi:DNA repair photolyase
MSLLALPTNGPESAANSSNPRSLLLGRVPHPEFVLQRGPYSNRPEILSLELLRGCAHRCAFCPARAASDHPGDEAIYLYDGLAQRLAVELTARKQKPEAVIVGASTDPFQRVPEVVAETLAVVATLACHQVPAWLTTRGSMSPEMIEELAQHRDWLRITVSLASADAAIQNAVESGASSVEDRLHLISQLRFNEIPVEVSIDPLLANLTDSKDQLQAILEALAERGVRQVSAGYLVLRPGVREQIEREWAEHTWLEPLLSAYADGPMLRDGGQISKFLHKSKRQRGYALLMSLAANFGISVRVNGIDNPDFQPARSTQHSHSRPESLQQTFRRSIRPDAIGA